MENFLLSKIASATFSLSFLVADLNRGEKMANGFGGTLDGKKGHLKVAKKIAKSHSYYGQQKVSMQTRRQAQDCSTCIQL